MGGGNVLFPQCPSTHRSPTPEAGRRADTEVITVGELLLPRPAAVLRKQALHFSGQQNRVYPVGRSIREPVPSVGELPLLLGCHMVFPPTPCLSPPATDEGVDPLPYQMQHSEK